MKSRADTGVYPPLGEGGHRAGSVASILRDNRQRVIDRGQLGRGDMKERVIGAA